MRLNRFESLLMNNPVRRASQRWIEAGWMRRFAQPLINGGRALEIGCGQGVGIEIILEMGAKEVHAFDVDPRALIAACRRVRGLGDRVLLWRGSADDIPASDASYDAVFDFGVLHHVPNWRDAVGEIARVLRPGGRFVGEEMLGRFITHPLSQRLFDHPIDDRFDIDKLSAEFQGNGFEVPGVGHFVDMVGWICAEKHR